MKKIIDYLRTIKKTGKHFSIGILLLLLGISSNAYALLHDTAIYAPSVQGSLTTTEQDQCADYIKHNINNTTDKTRKVFKGYIPDTVLLLTDWVNAHMNDGEQDLLLIIDMCPAALFQGETEGSLIEQWMKNGNMVMWTGSEPFAHYVDVDGAVHDSVDGASKVLDVTSSGLCSGGGLQEPSTAVRDCDDKDHNGICDPDDPDGDPDGDYDIASFVPYEAEHSLKYDKLLIDAETSDWDHMSYWRLDEVFAEDSENYQSDNLVLVNDDDGRFAQFYCLAGLNDARMQVITQVLNNWVDLPCNVLVVPDVYPTIQGAVDAAQPRDTVLVKAGTYYEQPILKRGIKVISDASDGGNDLLVYENFGTPGPPENPNANGPFRQSRLEDYQQYEADIKAHLVRTGQLEESDSFTLESKKVLRRTLRTIISGAFEGAEQRPMVKWAYGATVGSVLDGFTVESMPQVNHEIPGHAHVVETRGASGTIVNCVVRNNGSSGLGSHARFYDQDIECPGQPPELGNTPCRDFRYGNIKYDAHTILINNVAHNNEGNNLGNNHYSYALMYNNETFESISIGGHASPSIGCQHGAHPLIVKNRVYKSSWVGIGSKKGIQQGIFPINRPSHPIMRANMVFEAGMNDSSGTSPPDYDDPWRGERGGGIGGDDSGGFDPKTGELAYHVIEDNIVIDAANAAIGCRSMDPAYQDLPAGVEGEYPSDLGMVKITNNTAIKGGRVGQGGGIGINGGYAAEITGNTCYENNLGGIAIRGTYNPGGCDLIAENESYSNGTSGIGLCEGATVGAITYNILHDNDDAGIGHDGTEGRVNVTLESNNTLYNNGAAGIGMIAADVGQIANNAITNNCGPGITVTQATNVDLISNNTLDHNGIAGSTSGMPVKDGSHATVRDTTISYSGMSGITASGEGTELTLENCTLDHSGQCGLGPNLVVLGASVTLTDCTLDTTNGGPNIETESNGTVAMSGCTVVHSASGAIVADSATLNVYDTVFDENGLDATGGMLVSNSDIDFQRVTIANCAHYLFFSNCSGMMKDGKFYGNAWAGGGTLFLSGCDLALIGNVFHNPGGIEKQIGLFGGSDCRLYHNTILGNAEGGEGDPNQGPGTGLYVEAGSSATAINNIFDRLPRGIILESGAVVDASNNVFGLMASYDEFNRGIYGTDIIRGNPYLIRQDEYNFEPDCNSPCVDTGIAISDPDYGYVNDIFDGNAPDIGAIESPGLPCDTLEWRTPTALMAATLRSAANVIDDNIDTGNGFAPGPIYVNYAVFEIDSGNPAQVYGVRMYTAPVHFYWEVWVGDDPDPASSSWTFVSRHQGGPAAWVGWHTGQEDLEDVDPVTGYGWDYGSVDDIPTIMPHAKYIKIKAGNNYGPMPAKIINELDVLLNTM